MAEQQPVGVIDIDDVGELITLALREGALTNGERRNVMRIRDAYISIVQKSQRDAQVEAQRKAAEESKNKPVPQEIVQVQEPSLNGHHQNGVVKKTELATVEDSADEGPSNEPPISDLN